VNNSRKLMLLTSVALLTVCFVSSLKAQDMPTSSAFTLLNQGPPTIGLTSSAGGGIDTINLANLDINLTIPLNSLGAYGPKATSSLVMNSGFFIVFNWLLPFGLTYSQPQPFHVQMPGTYMYNWTELSGSGGCGKWVGVTMLGVISPDGGYHPTPSASVDGCNTTSYSGTGPDGWSIELSQYASSGQTYSSFSPSGIQSQLNLPAYYGYSNGYSIQSYDLHRNTVTANTMIPSRAGNANQTLQDALGNDALNVTTEQISGAANQQWQPTTITYPGPDADIYPFLGFTNRQWQRQLSGRVWHSTTLRPRGMAISQLHHAPGQLYVRFHIRELLGQHHDVHRAYCVGDVTNRSDDQLQILRRDKPE
jgi:hypothetical protein